jgi:aryl-alcohol dehydrogenase-like predicted oxidoreductase
MIEQRPLGKTGMSTPPLILGGNTFGWTADRDATFAILDAFYAGGGRMVDTADVYWAFSPGNTGGESETLIGEWTHARGHRDVIVATKVGVALDGSPGLAPARIEREVENALRRLQTDAIDLYFAHFPDPKTPVEESLGAFDKLVRTGKVKAIGASNHSAEQLREALDASRKSGLVEYAVAEPHYSLVSRGMFEGPLRDLCRDEGLGVIGYFSLASGFLTGKYRSEVDLADKAREPYVGEFLTPRNFRILDVVEDVARETHSSNVAVALAWLMAQPVVTAPIASASHPGHVEQMLAALELKLSGDQIERLDDVSALALAADGGA